MTCGSRYLMKLPCLLCSWNTPLVHIGLFIVASHYLVGHSFLFPEVSSCQVEVDTVGLWSILPCRDPSFPLTQNILALFTYNIYERYCFFLFRSAKIIIGIPFSAIFLSNCLKWGWLRPSLVDCYFAIELSEWKDPKTGEQLEQLYPRGTQGSPRVKALSDLWVHHFVTVCLQIDCSRWAQSRESAQTAVCYSHGIIHCPAHTVIGLNHTNSLACAII